MITAKQDVPTVKSNGTYEVGICEAVRSLLVKPARTPPEIGDDGIRRVVVDASSYREVIADCDSPWFMLFKYANLAIKHGKKVSIQNFEFLGRDHFHHQGYERRFKEIGVDYSIND
jgi:hypothetical protein